MSALESKLLLDIAQYQAQAATAQGEAKRLREKLEEMSRKGGNAIDATTAAMKRLEMAGQRTQALFAPKAVNPWTANAQAAGHYAQIVETKVVAAMHHAAAAQEAAANKAMRAQFLGSSMGSALDGNNALAMQAQRSRAAAGGGGRGAGKGGGNWALGGMAMQFQDIAVQAQMGTRASIILAQQGSQLLSVFGPAGMIAGGAIAVGGAFYTMGEKAMEAFKGVIASSQEFRAESGLLVQSTNASNLAGNLKLVREQMTALQDEQKSLNTFMGDWSARIGGGDPGKMTKKLQEEMEASSEIYGRAVDRALISSKQEVDIARLVAQGKVDEAEALERSIKLSNELARIDSMRIQDWAKEKLKSSAKDLSALDAVKPEVAKKEREDTVALEKKLHEEKLKSLEPAERYLELSKEQDAVFASMATQGGLFYDQSVAGLEAWAEANKKAGDTTNLLKVLKMLEKAKALQEQMAAADKEAKEGTVKSDEKRDKDKKESSGIAEAKTALDLEMKIAREKAASGKDDNAKIKAFRDELNTLQLTAQLEDRLHIQHAEALKMAKEKVAAERAATDAIQAQVKAEEAKKTLRSRQEEAAMMRVDKLRAGGHTREADAQERQIRVVREAQRIQATTKYSEAQAMAMARERIADQERAQKRANRDKRIGGGGGDDEVRSRISAHISGTQDQIRARNNARSREGWTNPLARDRDTWQPGRMSEQSWGSRGDARAPAPMAGMADANAAKDAASAKLVTFGSREFETLMAIKTGIEKLLD